MIKTHFEKVKDKEKDLEVAAEAVQKATRKMQDVSKGAAQYAVEWLEHQKPIASSSQGTRLVDKAKSQVGTSKRGFV